MEQQWRKDRATAFLVALQRQLESSPNFYGYVGDVWEGQDGTALTIDGEVSWMDIDAAIYAIDPKLLAKVEG